MVRGIVTKIPRVFFFFISNPKQVLSFTHPVSFHSAETFESLLGCLKMDDEKVAEAALQIFKNTGSKMEESFPHIKSYVSQPDLYLKLLFRLQPDKCNHTRSNDIIHIYNPVIIHTLSESTCSKCAALGNSPVLLAPPSVLLPVLQAKAKRGPPRQAKYAIHCINAMFTNRDTHFAQIFEVSHSP